MEAILKRLQELGGEMVARNKTFVTETVELRKNAKKLEESLAQSKELAEDLKRREAEVKFVENAIALKNEAIAEKKIQDQREAARQEETKKLIASVNARAAGIVKAQADIKDKQDGIDRQKVRLAEEEKNYKAKVLQQVQKDLDAAKKQR